MTAWAKKKVMRALRSLETEMKTTTLLGTLTSRGLARHTECSLLTQRDCKIPRRKVCKRLQGRR